MNQSELIAHVAQTAGLSKADATKVVGAFFEGIIASLKKGEEVRFTGFGSFKIADKPAREGRNPRTGETIQIAASRQCKFSAGKEFKDALNP